MLRVAPILLLLSLAGGCTEPEAGAVDTTGQVASADGVPIRYAVRGSGEPTLVLIHGWTNTSAIWGEHPATLSRSHRVVTLDLAGHGESGLERSDWTMQAFAGDVVAVVEELELQRIVLVGFSMGAAVALEAATHMPFRTTGVVLVDALHDPNQVPPPGTADQIERQLRTQYGDTAFLRAFAFDPDTPDSMVAKLRAMYPEQPREQWFPAIHALLEWARTDFGPTLEAVAAPVAAINATQQPTNVEAFRRYAPEFTVDTLQGVGHAGMLLQRVEDFDALLLALADRFSSTSGAQR
jgi:pimeloyl-ACP methyl ester carboxylesterase